MTADEIIEESYDVFDSEYRRLFPHRGDEQDHDEATRAALEAVLAHVGAIGNVTKQKRDQS